MTHSQVVIVGSLSCSEESDDSDEEMEVEGMPASTAAITPLSSRTTTKPPKHDLMMEEVRRKD